MDNQSYPIVLVQVAEEDGGGYTAFAPDLPGCLGDGETRSEAISDVERAIGEWLDEAARLNRKIPAPGSTVKRASEEMKDLRELISRQYELVKIQDEALTLARSEVERYRTSLAKFDAETNYLTNWAENGALLVTARTRSADDSLPH